MVLKMETCLWCERCGFYWLLLVEQFRDQIPCLVIGEAEAEFKLLHQIENESAHVDRILTRIEYLGQLTQTNLTLLLRQLVRIENFIDAIRDPVGVQYMRILQTWVVFVVQHNAQGV